MMARLWIHTATLLVLLVMLCPSSQTTEPQRLCGPHLVDALHLVCGESGFYYTPQTQNKPVQGRAAWGENENGAFKDQMEVIGKRNIEERCCARPCSILDLQSYCL
ncbi:insulin-like [Melanotaenia boesemani]|uniref:insulin-like n=1 Tax=Melanotaenia boesemani TaxID=1250792 RepID=UPI001C03BDBE|nr:insulin-like [Melanotaenia boesemani]